MLEGGLVARRPYLVVGPSGTGKSTLALQFLCEGVRQGEKALLVTVEEPPNETRLNHRGLEPDLDRVDVFDAIPDIMRYERTPFKDIAAVRHAEPFSGVATAIRRSPELSAVEVTMTGLEQMLRTEVVRRGYTRIAIDSLTALQYFCMKGFEPVAGAQAFLRFLSDLRITTLLTLESPLEDVESPERMLARGEIRLFRWELDGRSVRAIGVEKFRGSPHDVRLHPYRIGPRGLDINLNRTISRDTRQILEITNPEETVVSTITPAPVPEELSVLDPLIEQVRDLVAVGADVGPLRAELDGAFAATATGELDRVRIHLARVTSLVVALGDTVRERPTPGAPSQDPVDEAYQRIVARGESARAGVAPTELPPGPLLGEQLATVLSLLPVQEPIVDAPLPSKPTPPLPEEEPPLAAPSSEEASAIPSVAGPAPSDLPLAVATPVEEHANVAPVALTPDGGASDDEESPRVERVVGTPPEPPIAPRSPVPEWAATMPSTGESRVVSEARARPPSTSRPLPPVMGSTSPTAGPPAERPLPPLPGPRSNRVVRAGPPLPPPPPPPPVAAGPTRPTEDSAVARESRPPLPLVPGPGQADVGMASGPAAAPTAGEQSHEAGASSAPPGGPVSAPTVTPPKRRRRTSETSRRRTSSRTRAPAASASSVGVAENRAAGAPASPEPATGVGVATTKPRRRAARKRKAPTVLAATAGSAPADTVNDPSPRAATATPDGEPSSQSEAG